MADFQSIPINGTTEQLEKMLGMDIVEAVDEDSNDNQIPTAKAVRVAVGAGGNFVSYTPQSPTEAQQAQARQNIGAMQNGVADSDLDMAGHTVNNVASLRVISDVTGRRYNIKVGMREGADCFIIADTSAGGKIKIAGIADGMNDDDAATVGQLKAEKPYIIDIVQGNEETWIISGGAFSWDDFTNAFISGREIICRKSNVVIGLGSSITNYKLVYLDDNYATFASIGEMLDEISSIVIYKDSAIADYAYQPLAPDASLSLPNRPADAAAVGKKLGNIETALDSIIAIQESLIGGASE